MIERVWADEASVPADDRGLAYGDGLFETIRLNDGVPSLASAHLDRLAADAARLEIPAPREALSAHLQAAVSRYGRDGSLILKLMLTRGSGGRGYQPPADATPRLIISCHPLPSIPDRPVSVSVSLRPLVVDPLLAGIKSLNRLPQVLASAAMPAGAYDVIMTNADGAYLEGSKTNLLARVGTQWLSPPVESLAVAGVARRVVLEYLQSNGEPVVFRPLREADLHHPEFGGLMLMNSVVGGLVVGDVDGHQLPIHDGLAKIRSFLLDAVGS